MPPPVSAPRGRPPAGRRQGPAPRGVASVLAMLYLIVFAALALGFYAQTNMGTQIAGNERNSLNALLAAESGVAFIRYHLAAIQAKYQINSDAMLVEVANKLADRLNGTTSVGEVDMSPDGKTIRIPAGGTSTVNLGNGTGFRITIKQLANRQLVIQSIGTGRGVTTSNAGRGVEYVFNPKEWKAPLFDYGVAGRGPIEVSGTGAIQGGSNPAYGSVLSMSYTNPAVTVSSSGTISGKVWFRNPAGTASYGTNSSINGSTTAAGRTASTGPITVPAEYAGDPTWPEFPVIDTTGYRSFVKPGRNYSVLTGSTLRNLTIPANSGTVALPLTLSNVTIEGVVYVEAPNVISFGGGVTIRGVIVGANSVPSSTSLSTNKITFAGNVVAYDMSTLAQVYATNPTLLATEFPPELLGMTGGSIVMPTKWNVAFQGGYSSISGSIISDQLLFTGNAGGNLTGWILGLSNQKLTVGGSGGVTIEKPSTDKWPAGVYFRYAYSPQKGSYREFIPGVN